MLLEWRFWRALTWGVRTDGVGSFKVEQGLGGWDIAGSGRKKELGAAASNGALRCAVRARGKKKGPLL
jgi:hypothetical protein